MRKAISCLLGAVVLATPAVLLAGETADAMLGGALGGALGAAVGSELGGRNGAIVGSAIGGATGTAITTRRYRRSYPQVIYVERPVYTAPRSYGPPPYYPHPGRHLGHYKHRQHYDD